MDFNLWHDCLDNEEIVMLCKYQYEHYGTLPDIRQLPPHKLSIPEEEPDPLVLKVMTATPGEVKHWPRQAQ